MKKVIIATILIIVFGLIIPPFFTQAAAVKIYFGGKILSSFTLSISVGGYGVSLGPLAKVKDEKSGSTILVLAPASLGKCTKGHHMIGIGQGANWYSYGYFIVLLGFCD